MANSNSIKDGQQNLFKSLQQITDLSFSTVQPIMESVIDNVSRINNSVADLGIPTLNILSNKSKDCCTPKRECPPFCIATITRHASANERIVVPILITNKCSSTKTYRIGVRELKNNDGKAAINQPSLNKSSVTLEPNRSESVLMTIDLNATQTNEIYSTEIVVREREINQNICFKLYIDNANQTEVIPNDEKKYKLKWLDWQSHFYCEPKAKTRLDLNQLTPNHKA